jgi:hypothetical protein
VPLSYLGRSQKVPVCGIDYNAKFLMQSGGSSMMVMHRMVDGTSLYSAPATFPRRKSSEGIFWYSLGNLLSSLRDAERTDCIHTNLPKMFGCRSGNGASSLRTNLVLSVADML